MAGLKLEIVQQRPFASLEEEALLNLLRTADCLHRAFQLQDPRLGHDLDAVQRVANSARRTAARANLRGHRQPDDHRRAGHHAAAQRLKALKLIRQQRDRQDRRVVWTQISEAGLELLREMDPVIWRRSAETAGAAEPGGTGGTDPSAGVGPEEQ